MASSKSTVSRCGGTGAGPTYAQVVAILSASNTLVAQWHLTEGATPYADTSGFAPADPATEVRQVLATAMTQAYSPGPLTRPGGQKAVAFNFDGTAATGTGDYLTDACATPARYQFAANLPFTAIAWVVPFGGAVVHPGPVINTIHGTGIGGGGAHDDGWRLAVSQPGLIPTFERAANCTAGVPYDTASGAALSTTAWSMLAGTYDGANIRLYVNGALAATTASAGAVLGAATNGQIGIGQLPLAAGGTWHYGAVGEASVWSSVLSASAIAQLYTAGTT